jgi:hypothetical protein
MADLTLEEKATNYETYKHIEVIRNLLNMVVAELLRRGEIHDQSKLGDVERQTFVEYTPKLKGSTYGSEEYKGFLQKMKPALDNHYAHNRHHPEWKRANEEKWLPVVGYEGLYEVSNFGDVRSLERVAERSGPTGDVTVSSRVLKPHVTPKGYLRLQLKKDGLAKNHQVHRLVATAFLGAPQGRRDQVNHLNGDKQDNYLGNLEWVTPSENLKHAYDEGLRPSGAKFVVHCVEEDLTTLGIQKMVVELHKRGYEGVNSGGIWRCIEGDGVSHLDLTFTSENVEVYGPRSDMRFMNLVDLLEMIIDWKAASMRHDDGDVMRSIDINTKRFGMDPQLVKILQNTVRDFGLDTWPCARAVE